jgi:hypothetical protein
MVDHAEKVSRPGTLMSSGASEALDGLRPGLGAIWRHEIMAAMLLPALSSAERRFAAAQVATDQVVVAAALERARLANGKYPEALMELTPRWLSRLPVDFISGEDFRYRTDGDGYVLYSIGWNRQDDGGQPGPHLWNEKTGEWVWQVSAAE